LIRLTEGNWETTENTCNSSPEWIPVPLKKQQEFESLAATLNFIEVVIRSTHTTSWERDCIYAGRFVRQSRTLNTILGFAMCKKHIASISDNSALAGRKFINSDTWNSHEKRSFNKQSVQVWSSLPCSF